MTPGEAAEVLRTTLFPKWEQQRARVDKIDKWAKWDHELPTAKSASTRTEHRLLQERSRTPWGMLVVSSIAQGLFIEGYRQKNESDNAAVWDLWQINSMDARQGALFRAALTYGDAYTTVLPGTDALTGEPAPLIRCWSPRELIAFYDDPATDVWPVMAARFRKTGRDWLVDLMDETQVHTFRFGEYDAGPTEHVVSSLHGFGVVPVVRWLSVPDVTGHADGMIEPHIEIFKRLDQTKYDRLMVQHHSSWKVRTISGLELQGDKSVTEEKMRLSQEDILVAPDPDTKFGTLAESPLAPFVAAYESDLRDLSAITQIPPHFFLGSLVNLSAEALAAAESGMTAQRDEQQHSLGEAAEQTLRLAAKAAGMDEAARDHTSQVIWKDTQSRSLAQIADAYGKIAQMLGFPPELLWDKLPGFTTQEIEAAKARMEQGGVTEQLMRSLLGDTEPVGV